jgi:hypothetical protein
MHAESRLTSWTAFGESLARIATLTAEVGKKIDRFG